MTSKVNLSCHLFGLLTLQGRVKVTVKLSIYRLKDLFHSAMCNYIILDAMTHKSKFTSDTGTLENSTIT